MGLYAGQRWRDGRAEPGWVRIEDGRVADEGRGGKPGAQRALVLDGVANLHTHIGDAFLLGEELPRDLAALVAPGTGLKHRRLAQADPARLRAAMRRYLEDARTLGVSWIVDFREEGVAGIAAAREAARHVPGITAYLLGRTTEPGAPLAEAEKVLAVADGLGLPSLRDVGSLACARLSRAAHAAGKPLALHASEGVREPIEEILALGPDLLVHLSSAERSDLRLVAEAGVPVATCPSSNAFFGLRAATAALHEVGAAWHLGTDNAMLGNADPVREAALAREADPRLPDAEFARALTTPPWKAINRLRPDAQPRPSRVRVVPLAADGAARWDGPPIVGER